MASGKPSKSVRAKRLRRANFCRQQHQHQREQQQRQQRIDEGLAQALEDFHINPLDHQQMVQYNQMWEERDSIIVFGRILLVLIFLAILWNIRLMGMDPIFSNLP